MFAQQADQAFLPGRTMIYPCLLTAAILLELEPASSEVVMTWNSDMGEGRLLGRCAESDRADRADRANSKLVNWKDGWDCPVRVRVEHLCGTVQLAIFLEGVEGRGRGI